MSGTVAMTFEMVKQAGLGSEITGSVASGVIPFIGGVGNIGGMAAAGVMPARSKEEQDEASKEVGTNFIPGRGAYNMYKRIGRTAQDYRESPDSKQPGAGEHSQLRHEVIGDLVNSTLLSALGAGGGALLAGGKGVKPGALAGLGVSALASLVAGVAALVNKRRGRKEQMEYEVSSPALSQYVIPGFAAYNKMKRLGYSIGEYDK